MATPTVQIHSRLSEGDRVRPKLTPKVTGIVLEVDHEKRTCRVEMPNRMKMTLGLDAIVVAS